MQQEFNCADRYPPGDNDAHEQRAPLYTLSSTGVSARDARTHVGFSAFCAEYHEQDRVAVVSPRLEDGILHTGYALLALTTAFFDAQRARGGDFFVYPQHFAIIGADRSGVATGAGRLELAAGRCRRRQRMGMARRLAKLELVHRAGHADRHAAQSLRSPDQPPVLAARLRGGGYGLRRTAARLCAPDSRETPQIGLLLQVPYADGRDKRRPAGRGNRPGEYQSPAPRSYRTRCVGMPMRDPNRTGRWA